MHHLETLFDRALDAVIGMDARGDVIAWNQAAEGMFGWTRAEAMGRLLGDLIVPKQHRDPHRAGLERYNETGHGPVLEQRVKITALHREGIEFPVELSIFPMAGEGQENSFYAFIRSLAAEEAHNRQQQMRAREAEVLLKVAERLIEDTSLEDFTQYCLEQVCQIAGMQAAHLYYVRNAGSGEMLVPSGTWHIAEERFRPIIDATTSLTFRPGEGMPGRAWSARKMLVLNDLGTDQSFLRRDIFREVNLTRGIALPIQHGEKTHAVMEFFGPSDSRIDPEILRMLQTIGTQIGVAIRRKEAAEYRETLRRELSHRVGNSLAVLASIYRNCARQAESIEELTEAFLGRLTTMGQANQMSIKDVGSASLLGELVKQTISILPSADDVTIDMPELIIDSDWVVPLSLTIHELATNFLKYGAIDQGSALSISAEVYENPRELHFTWRETRVSPQQASDAPTGSGFGTQLIQAMIEGRLNGSFERISEADGFVFRATIPLPREDDGFRADPIDGITCH